MLAAHHEKRAFRVDETLILYVCQFLWFWNLCPGLAAKNGFGRSLKCCFGANPETQFYLHETLILGFAEHA